MAAIAEPLRMFTPSSGMASRHRRQHPSIADIRPAATLEFLAVIDYALPNGRRSTWRRSRRNSARPMPSGR